MKLREILQRPFTDKTFTGSLTVDDFNNINNGYISRDFSQVDILQDVIIETEYITTLLGCPKSCQEFGLYKCSQLSSLEHSPLKVKLFSTRNCENLKSAEGIGRRFILQADEIYLGKSFQSNILGLMLIKGLSILELNESSSPKSLIDAVQIIKSSLDKDIIACKEELMTQGLKEYAKL